VAGVVDRAFVYNFHFLGFVFAALVALMIGWAAVAPRAEPWRLETQTPIDMTPWKAAPWASLGLVAIVVAIYGSFASFSPPAAGESGAPVPALARVEARR